MPKTPSKGDGKPGPRRKKKRTNYQIGREFEYRSRNKLLDMGAVYVMRAASSKGAADLIALFPLGKVWLVQCKRDGRLPKTERTTLIDIADKTGAMPTLAKAGKNGRGVEFVYLEEN